MTSKRERLVQLGFSEPIADASHRKVIAHHSPNWLDWDGGKIGGIPSWLNPRDLPTQAPFRCPACVRRNTDNNNKNNKETTRTTTIEKEKKEGTIMRFITQIYSPADKDTSNQNAFHRSLYVFACPHPKCSIQSGIVNEENHDSILVLRGQLACDNEFYPMDCNEEEIDNNNDEDGVLWEETWDKNKSTAWDVQTCAICNQRATGYCPKLQKWFCSKDHQRDYNNIIVKKKMMGVSRSIIRYAESELVVEEEPVDEGNDDDDDNGTDNVDDGGKDQEKLAQKLNETSLFAGEEKDDNGDDADDGVNDELLEQSDLNDMTGVNNTVGGTSDPITMEFYSRIGVADGDVKSQCLRYCRWPKEQQQEEETEEDRNCGPLWISSQCRPRTGKNDIPPCEYCGAERKFEFQIMPQMVNFLLTKDWSEETNDNGDGDSDAKKALLVASDIVQKADESGTGETLPEAFREKQEELVKKFKDKILTKDENGKDIDWGTIAVYTCTASCGGGTNVNDETFGGYRKEFAWRQPTLDTLDS